MENQLTILSESLDKKLSVLKEIQRYNKEQEQCFLEERANLESFDAAIAQKDRLIQQLQKLDEGFELLYARLAEQLKANRSQYADQIRELQDKIRQVTELGVSIQAQEKRNKALVEQYFAKQRSSIRQGRKSSAAALKYYKNMSGNNVKPPSFLDSKK